MPKIYIKDSGTWKQVGRIYVKDAGSWKPLLNGSIKDAGTIKQFYPDTFTPITYTSPGTYSLTIPAGKTSVTVAYPSISGLVSSTVSVVPFSTYTVTVGDYGFGSSFGVFNAPAFVLNVTENATNVDQSPGLYIDQEVATSVTRTFTGSGTQDTLEPAALAAGIYYNEYNEGNQGDFIATVTLRTTAISYLTNSYRVEVTSFTGRGSYDVPTQPSSGNGYRYTIRIFDPAASNAAYTFTTQLQQIVSLSIS